MKPRPSSEISPIWKPAQLEKGMKDAMDAATAAACRARCSLGIPFLSVSSLKEKQTARTFRKSSTNIRSPSIQASIRGFFGPLAYLDSLSPKPDMAPEV